MVVVQILRVCDAIILVVGEAAGCETKIRVEGAIELGQLYLSHSPTRSRLDLPIMNSLLNTEADPNCEVEVGS